MTFSPFSEETKETSTQKMSYRILHQGTSELGTYAHPVEAYHSLGYQRLLDSKLGYRKQSVLSMCTYQQTTYGHTYEYVTLGLKRYQLYFEKPYGECPRPGRPTSLWLLKLSLTRWTRRSSENHKQHIILSACLPVFPNHDSYVSGDFTISPPGLRR